MSDKPDLYNDGILLKKLIQPAKITRAELEEISSTLRSNYQFIIYILLYFKIENSCNCNYLVCDIQYNYALCPGFQISVGHGPLYST